MRSDDKKRFLVWTTTALAGFGLCCSRRVKTRSTNVFAMLRSGLRGQSQSGCQTLLSTRLLSVGRLTSTIFPRRPGWMGFEAFAISYVDPVSGCQGSLRSTTTTATSSDTWPSTRAAGAPARVGCVA